MDMTDNLFKKYLQINAIDGEYRKAEFRQMYCN